MKKVTDEHFIIINNEHVRGVQCMFNLTFMYLIIITQQDKTFHLPCSDCLNSRRNAVKNVHFIDHLFRIMHFISMVNAIIRKLHY